MLLKIEKSCLVALRKRISQQKYVSVVNVHLIGGKSGSGAGMRLFHAQNLVTTNVETKKEQIR